MLARIVRPKITVGSTYEVDTGCESLYITIASAENNGKEPIEVMSRMGKAGGCTSCLNQALGRVISIGLQWGVPISEYADTLRGLQCDNPKPFPKDERCLSCPDAISIAIRRHLEDGNKTSP